MWLGLVIVLVLMINLIFGCEKNFYCSRDCQDVMDMGFKESGVYRVTPVGTYQGIDVYCDMETEDGGWLVFQRGSREPGTNFTEWIHSNVEIGTASGMHWLGYIPLYTIVLQGHYELRIDFEAENGNRKFAKYNYFALQRTRRMFYPVVVEHDGNADDCLKAGNSLNPPLRLVQCIHYFWEDASLEKIEMKIRRLLLSKKTIENE